MRRRTERTFFQRGNADGQQAHEKMLKIVNHQGNANQNHIEASPHSCQNGCHQKDKRYILVRMWRKRSLCSLLVVEINFGEDVEKKESLFIVGGNVNWYNHYRKEYGDSSKN